MRELIRGLRRIRLDDAFGMVALTALLVASLYVAWGLE